MKRTIGELIPLLAAASDIITNRISLNEVLQTFSDDELYILDNHFDYIFPKYAQSNNMPDTAKYWMKYIKEEIVNRSRIQRDHKLNELL